MMVQIKRSLIVLGLVVLSLPMIVFFPNYGTGDMDIWLEWTSHVDMWGPLNAYSFINARQDYWTVHPPIYFINFWLALKAAAVFNVSSMIGIKIILLFYYLATWASLIYLSTLSSRKTIWMGIVVSSGLFLGGLYFVVNSLAFSYLDITFAPFVVFSFALFARRRYLLSGICLALAVLVKWIVIVLLPVFLFYFIYKLPRAKSPRHSPFKLKSMFFLQFIRGLIGLGILEAENKKGRWYKIDTPMFKFVEGMILIFGLLIIGFWLDRLSLFPLVESLRKASNHGSKFFAPGSLNFSWIIGYVVIKLMYPDTYGMIIKNYLHFFASISALIFLFVSLAILKSFLKRGGDMGSLLQASLMISWSYFIWRTGVHENHLFISVLIALCLAIINTSWSNIRQYFWLSFFGLVNLVVFYGFPVRGGFVFAIPDNFGLWGLLAVFHVLIYLVYLRSYLLFQPNGAKD